MKTINLIGFLVAWFGFCIISYAVTGYYYGPYLMAYGYFAGIISLFVGDTVERIYVDYKTKKHGDKK